MRPPAHPASPQPFTPSGLVVAGTVVPASFFGQHRACWRKGHSKCVKSDGTPFKGRACCARVDRTFKRIEADLHNLTPAVGELNGDRSNLPYGMVAGEERLYGACDFEIGGTPKVTEPRDAVRGDAARIWLYMTETYKIKLTTAQRNMFDTWSKPIRSTNGNGYAIVVSRRYRE